MTKHDEQWEKWCSHFDAAEQDIHRLFHNRHVWLTIGDMLERSAREIGFNAIIQNWLTTNYAFSQCTGIRRECDPDTRTSSLERCLARLIESPRMASRARYEVGILANPNIPDQYRQMRMSDYDEFAVSPGSPDLDTRRVQADLYALRDAAAAARKYTNKVVAHREVVGETITLVWADLDQALNAVGGVLKRYYKLRHPGTKMGNLTPELPAGWEKPFRSPWCPDGYWPRSARPADDHVHTPGTS